MEVPQGREAQAAPLSYAVIGLRPHIIPRRCPSLRASLSPDRHRLPPITGWGLAAKWPGFRAINTAATAITRCYVHAKLDEALGLIISGSRVCRPPGFLDGEHRYTAVDVEAGPTCAITDQATVLCWGRDEVGENQPPEGSFVAISVDFRRSCGVRADARLICWGQAFYGSGPSESAQFVDVSLGGAFACGLTKGRDVVCWGETHSWWVLPPDRRFQAVTSGSSHACGLTVDGEIARWGFGESSQLTAPSGQIVAVDAGVGLTCALDARGKLTC